MKRGQRIWLGALAFLISVLLFGLAGDKKGCMTVYAAEDTVDYDAVESGAESKLFSEFDFSEIDN
ncbi:stage III sporulation protein AF, partial [Romboutsia ilealis]|nr:stage III sporulation protein AF [Romboutsia ilealis]